MMTNAAVNEFHNFHLHIKNIPSEENIEEILKLYMESESNTKNIKLSFNKNKKEALIQYNDCPKSIHKVIECINNRQLFQTTMTAKPAIFKKRLVIRNLHGIVDNAQELQLYLEQKNLQPAGLSSKYEVKVRYDAQNHVAIATLPNNADINKYLCDGEKYIRQNVIFELCDYFTTLQDLTKADRMSPTHQNILENMKIEPPLATPLQNNQCVGGTENRRVNRGHSRQRNRARGYRGGCRVVIEGVEKHVDSLGHVIYERNIKTKQEEHNSGEQLYQQRPYTNLNQNQPYSSNSYHGYGSQNPQLDHHNNKKLVGAHQIYNISHNRGNQNRRANRSRRNPCVIDSQSCHGDTDEEKKATQSLSYNITAENLEKLSMQPEMGEKHERNVANGNNLSLQHRSHSQTSLLSNSSHLSQPSSKMGLRFNDKLKPGQIVETVKVCNEIKKEKCEMLIWLSKSINRPQCRFFVDKMKHEVLLKGSEEDVIQMKKDTLEALDKMAYTHVKLDEKMCCSLISIRGITKMKELMINLELKAKILYSPNDKSIQVFGENNAVSLKGANEIKAAIQTGQINLSNEMQVYLKTKKEKSTDCDLR